VIFLYDGDCGFCTSSARFIERHVPSPARIVPWQRADLREIGLTPEQCAESVRWVGDDGSRGAGPVAIGHLLRSAGGRLVSAGVAAAAPAGALAGLAGISMGVG